MACASPWLDQGQPDDATDVQHTELSESGRGMKFRLDFETVFITEMAIHSFLFRSLHYIARSRNVIYRPNRAELETS